MPPEKTPPWETPDPNLFIPEVLEMLNPSPETQAVTWAAAWRDCVLNTHSAPESIQ